MNKVGRPAISEEEKKRKGTLRKCRTKPQSKGAPMIGGLPVPPNTLGELGAAEWRRVIDCLDKTKQISPSDLGNLEMMCMEYERYLACVQRIKENPTGSSFAYLDKDGNVKGWGLHPDHIAAQHHLKAYNMLSNDFGFSPASRGKIGAPTAERPASKAADLLKKAI